MRHWRKPAGPRCASALSARPPAEAELLLGVDNYAKFRTAFQADRSAAIAGAEALGKGLSHVIVDAPPRVLPDGREIRTQADQKAAGVRPYLIRIAPERVLAVETGACPHSAIREDPTLNMQSADDLDRRFPGLELILIESGGDNLASSFSLDLVDYWMFVIDVAGGFGAIKRTDLPTTDFVCPTTIGRS